MGLEKRNIPIAIWHQPKRQPRLLLHLHGSLVLPHNRLCRTSRRMCRVGHHVHLVVPRFRRGRVLEHLFRLGRYVIVQSFIGWRVWLGIDKMGGLEGIGHALILSAMDRTARRQAIADDQGVTA